MCFSLLWLFQLLVWLVVIGAVFAIIRLLLPHVLGFFGGAGALVTQILWIILWAVVLVAIIWLAYDLITCLFGGSLRLRP